MGDLRPIVDSVTALKRIGRRRRGSALGREPAIGFVGDLAVLDPVLPACGGEADVVGSCWSVTSRHSGSLQTRQRTTGCQISP